MKVLMLNYEFPPLGGGAANATKFMLMEFKNHADLEIDLITSSTEKFKVKRLGNNITIHFLNIHKKGNLHYQSYKNLLYYSWKAYRYARELIQKKHYDVCHAFFGIPCGYLAMKIGIPYIVGLRGSDVPFYNNRFKILDNLNF